MKVEALLSSINYDSTNYSHSVQHINTNTNFVLKIWSLQIVGNGIFRVFFSTFVKLFQILS